MSSETISLDASAHPVRAVTIFQSPMAQLTRTFTGVELKRGRSVLEIFGISCNVDTESPRIHGMGADAHVVDISCNVKRLKASSQRRSKNTAAIKILEAKRRLLNAERKVREAEWDALSLAVVSDKSTSFDELMATFVTSKRNAIQAVVEMKEKIRDVDEEIELLKDSHKGDASALVVVTLLTKTDCKLEFQLTYLVSGVIWKPYYDLHGGAVDGKPSLGVSLHYSANITQATGEDWTNTVLTLSTANSHTLYSLTVPEVDPLRLVPSGHSKITLNNTTLPAIPPYSPSMPQACMRPPAMELFRNVSRDNLSDISSASSSRLFSPSDREFEDRFVKNGPADSAVLDKNPLSLAYRVKGQVSLPSDGLAHKVSIAVLKFPAALNYVCVPCKTSAVFMEGQIQNTSEYELLGGPVSVFMDDSFVTKTSLGHIGVNESFTCVLGIDTSLKVSYHTKSHTEHEPKRNFSEPSKTTTRTITTTITNGHTFDIAGLVVRDAIPLGHDEGNIKVVLRRPHGLAQAKDGEEVDVMLPEQGETGDSERQQARVRWTRTENMDGGEKEGLYEWVCEIKAGKKIRLEAEWEVKAPSNAQWEEQLNVDGEQRNKV